MRKTLLTIFGFVILLGCVMAVAEVSRKETLPPKMVRVAIVREARELNIEIKGTYTFIDWQTKKNLATGRKLVKGKVRLLEKGLFVGTNVYAVNKLIIRPAKDSFVIINNRNFRGDIILMRTPNDRILAINAIGIEDYIKGVLYHEISHHWAMEALKTQAVATRTYALYKMESSKNNDYDVTNDIYSQVYGGKDSERYRTGLAVDRTTGEILSYKDKILPAYFHATCAGMTEDVKEVWNSSLPPLNGVPCMFCQTSPHMNWKRNYRLHDIQSKLNKKGFSIGAIKEISVIERNRSNRIKNLRITDRDGREIIIAGKDFRETMGPNELKSNNYEIIMQGYYVDIIGKGWGHGVGLCQWGAKGMADQQFTYKQILAYYYPGSLLIDYHILKESTSPSTKTSSANLDPAVK